MSLPDLAAGAILAAAGIAGWQYWRARSPGHRYRPVGGAPRHGSRDVPGEPTADTADEVATVLRRLAPWLDATRLIVWERDAEKALLRPLYGSHDLPAPVPAAGDPVAWALDQAQPLRLDRTPVWAHGSTTAAPLEGGRVLTAESDDSIPDPYALAHAADLLAPVLALHERERSAAALGGRFDRFVAFLSTLPSGARAEDFPDELARAIGEMADADGAIVAACGDDGAGGGQVLASWGTGGGPAPGTYFGVGDGDLAAAARVREVIHRDPAGRMPALAQPGEKWARAPKYRVAVPMVAASGDASGVIAIWGDVPAGEVTIDLLRGLAPLLALQLQHSTDLVRFRQAAHEDGLTGLANRAALEARLIEERNRFDRYRRAVSLLVLDLDHFKHINDTWGHAAGDTVLQRVAEIVRRTVREVDFAARFGGEELVVVLPETMRREAGEVAERIRAAIGQAVIEWNGQRIPVTASIGVSSCTETVDEPDKLLRSADAALYVSKEAGRNRVTVAEPDTSADPGA
ncbi:MAG TPA: GGDEF domain-containing protein [Longimicrobiales bacterium]|nr:GGDEF domain-containing protein [Longimicrobiales bacterium]